MIKSKANTDKLDRDIEKILANLLGGGVIIAASVVIVGAFLFLVRHGSEVPNYGVFKPDSFNYANFTGLFEGIISFRPASIMQLGILLLIATPVLRVLFSVFAFIYEKDYTYFVFTIFVFCVLILSFVS